METLLLWGIGFVDVDRDYLSNVDFYYAVKVTIHRELWEQAKIRRQVQRELWKERFQ